MVVVQFPQAAQLMYYEKEVVHKRCLRHNTFGI